MGSYRVTHCRKQTGSPQPGMLFLLLVARALHRILRYQDRRSSKNRHLELEGLASAAPAAMTAVLSERLVKAVWSLGWVLTVRLAAKAQALVEALTAYGSLT